MPIQYHSSLCSCSCQQCPPPQLTALIAALSSKWRCRSPPRSRDHSAHSGLDEGECERGRGLSEYTVSVILSSSLASGENHRWAIGKPSITWGLITWGWCWYFFALSERR